MDYKSKQEDLLFLMLKNHIGKRVSLIINLEKILHIGEIFFLNGKNEVEIPYEAIINYNFLFKTEDKPRRKIVNSGSTKRKIPISFVAKELGATGMYVLGDIIEIAEDYLKIKRVERNDAYYLSNEQKKSC